MSRTLRAVSIAFALPALALVGACKLTDTVEPESSYQGPPPPPEVWDLKLESRGPLLVTTQIAVRVVSSQSGSVSMQVDGNWLSSGPFPLNADVLVPLSGVLDGPHVLTAIVSLAPRYWVSNSLSFEKHAAAPVAVLIDPPPGRLASATPPVFRIVFSEPLDPASLAAVTLDAAQVGPLPASVTLSADAREMAIAMDRTIADFDSVWFTVAPRDALGNVGWVAASYYAPRFSYWIAGLPSAASGLLNLTVTAQADFPDGVEVWAGSHLLASATGGSPWQVSWDTRTVPDGTYQVTVVPPPGWRTDPWRCCPASVTVDNTPPRLVGCLTPSGAPDLAVWEKNVVAVFSEPVGQPRLVVRVDGLEVPATSGWNQDRVHVELGQPPIAPATLTLEFPDPLVDRAGNASPPGESCSLALPPWLAYWADPIQATEPVAAREVAAGYSLTLGIWPSGGIEWIDPLGVVRAASAVPFEPFAVLAPLNLDRSATAEGLTGEALTAWVERLPGGPGQVVRGGGRLNIDLAHDARNPSAHGWWLAWSEETALGGRAVALRSADYPYSLLDPPASDPAGVIDFPRVSALGPPVDPSVASVPEGPFLAWLDLGAPGTAAIPTLRAFGRHGGSWTPMGNVLNADPGSPASEPSFRGWSSGALVAWLEGGAVLARRWPGGSFAWSAAVPLDAAPGASVRSPRAWVRTVWPALEPPLEAVVFVETVGGIDSIQVRRWDGSAWVPVPSPTTGWSGTVTAMSVPQANSLLTVAWADELGQVRIRTWNR